MSTAIVSRHRPLMPTFSLLLAGGAAVLSGVAITDHGGSTAATRAAPAATVSVASPTPSRGGNAHPGHAVPAHVAQATAPAGVCGLRINNKC